MESDARASWLDFVAFSGVLPAAVAAALTAACAVALVPLTSLRGVVAPALLAAAGTLVVYDVDRLCDVESDRATAPERSDFVASRRGLLMALTVCGGVVSVPVALQMPPAVWLLCAVVLALGLWHRRLKGSTRWKTAYVTISWLGVVVGLPVASAGGAEPLLLVVTLGSLGATIAANLMASDLRGHVLTDGVLRELASARALAIAGTAICLLDRRTWPLMPVAFCESLALVRFQSSERYGLVVVDGALLAGAVLSLALSTSGL